MDGWREGGLGQQRDDGGDWSNYKCTMCIRSEKFEIVKH